MDSFDIDAMSLAANFGLLAEDQILRLRVVVIRSDPDQAVVISDRVLSAEDIEELSFACGRPVQARLVMPGPAFDETLVFMATEAGISDAYVWTMDCSATYHRRCPGNWFQFAKTDCPGVRLCPVCRADVHLVVDQEQATELASQGLRVAFVAEPSAEDYARMIETYDGQGRRVYEYGSEYRSDDHEDDEDPGSDETQWEDPDADGFDQMP